MSLGEISVTIQAVNEATPTFQAIGSDATEMGNNVRASASSFDDLGTHAEATTVKLSTVARGISSVSSLGLGLTTLATDFGLVDSQTTKYVRTILATITVVSEVARLISYSTVLTTGHTASVALDTSTETASAGASLASTVATNIKTAATWLATTAENALNISQATFLALTGIGIAVIIAAAAAVAYFASQMNNATASVNAYNSAATNTTTNMTSISRAGQQALSRQGVESATP
ncbi:MAG: hypothetical protein ABSB10_00525 [Candidatus Bathyarchaeia archaeon]|jgi:hypothetical protein